MLSDEEINKQLLQTACDSLKEIDLSGNNIDACAVGVLADVLKVNTTIQKLNLSSSNIGDSGAELLAAALHTNTSLQSLSLSFNNINVKGNLALAEALKVNTSLQELKLGDKTRYTRQDFIKLRAARNNK